MKLLESGLSYKNGYWEATYPWIRDTSDLPNNYSTALAIVNGQKKQLCR